MTNEHLSTLWQRIQARLDSGRPDWRREIDGFGQVAAAEKRAMGLHWSDNDVFECLLRAVLSSNSDWSKVENVLPELCEVFHGFSLARYAEVTNRHVAERIVPWFSLRGANTSTLEQSLGWLITAAQRLKAWSLKCGSAEDFFTSAVRENGNDPKFAALAIAKSGGEWKLTGLGVPLAAETLRNLGFDVVKPDRHVCRASGSFGLVSFRNWKNRSRTEAPKATPKELRETMTQMEHFAKVVGERPTFLDNAVWFLCAKMGLYLSNDELRELGRPTSS